VRRSLSATTWVVDFVRLGETRAPKVRAQVPMSDLEREKIRQLLLFREIEVLI
jgi:hypothetical protein